MEDLFVEGWVRDKLGRLSTHKVYRPDGMHPCVLKELTNVAKPVSIIFEKNHREGLMGDVVVGGHVGCSDHEIIEFSITGETRRGSTKTSTLDFWRADFGLFKKLIRKDPWKAALKNKGVWEGWMYFEKVQ